MASADSKPASPAAAADPPAGDAKDAAAADPEPAAPAEEKTPQQPEKKRGRRKKGEAQAEAAVKTPPSRKTGPAAERPSRERKTVERYSELAPRVTPAKKSPAIVQGSGTKLKDIPNVSFKLSKRKTDENLQSLHTLMYGRKSNVHFLKRNISQFSGFVWTDNEGKHRTRIKEKLDKFNKEKLLDFCDILDIYVPKASTKKEEVSAKVLEFLESPCVTRDVVLTDKKKGKKRGRRPKGSGEATPEGASAEKKRKRGRNQAAEAGKENDDEEDGGPAGSEDASTGDEGDRRYKKLVAPAFTDHNNRLVWTETVRVVAELVDEVWGDQKNIVVDHCLDITLPIALYVLSAAVFGNKISWKETNVNPAGHQMSFKDALHYASMDLLLKAAVPDWALSLTARTRRTRLAFQELGTYMKEMLQDRMSSPNTEHHDLFSILLASSSMGDAKDENLTGDEVLGNVFIFLVAGHESSAHTLCFLFALLALYQDEQEKLYQHIISVLPDKRIPVYDDMPQLTRSTAVLYETLRLFPPVIGIPKVAAQDATITFGSQSGDRKTLPISKGSRFMINTPALHHNPRYWSNPDEFQPERFMTPDWPRDAFLPFSGGPRSCLGRKFFETEAVAALTMIVSRYKVTVKQEPQFIGETFEQTKARITTNKTGVTVNPIRVPLVFTRRD